MRVSQSKRISGQAKLPRDPGEYGFDGVEKDEETKSYLAVFSRLQPVDKLSVRFVVVEAAWDACRRQDKSSTSVNGFKIKREHLKAAYIALSPLVTGLDLT